MINDAGVGNVRRYEILVGESVVGIIDVIDGGLVVVVDDGVRRCRRRRFQHILLVEGIASHRRRPRPVLSRLRTSSFSLGRRGSHVSPLIIGRLTFALRTCAVKEEQERGKGKGGVGVESYVYKREIIFISILQFGEIFLLRLN